jgi:hypothetical protein
MIKILQSSSEQMHLLEAMLRDNQNMYLVARGDNVPLWRVQKGFSPAVEVREYELALRGGIWPVKLRFEFNDIQKRAELRTNRRGIEALKQCMPDIFGEVSVSGEAETIEVKKYVPKTNPKATGTPD